MEIGLLLLATLAGAALYRWRGHASKYKKFFPRPFNQIAFALPYTYLAYEAVGWYCILVLLGTTLALVSGHGKWMDMGSWDKKVEDETLEFFIKWLEGKVSERSYDFLGLVVSGVSITVSCSLALFIGGMYLSGAILLASGITKAIGYDLSWRYWNGTDGGEWLCGGFLWLFVFGLIIYT